MASEINRAQQLFSKVVPEWLSTKVGANKTAAFAVLAFVALVALAVVVRRSLRSVTVGDVKKPTTPDDKPKTEQDKVNKDGETKIEPAKVEPAKTPPPSPSKVKVKASKDVGLGNTLYVNGSPMKNDGTAEGWEVEVEGPISLVDLKFSINDPNNIVPALPFVVEDVAPPTL